MRCHFSECMQVSGTETRFYLMFTPRDADDFDMQSSCKSFHRDYIMSARGYITTTHGYNTTVHGYIKNARCYVISARGEVISAGQMHTGRVQ